MLELKSIGKSFGATRALDNVTFDLRPGEVHVLAGENGAGKSTLIKILAGVHPEYEGEIRLDGRRVQLAGPGDARQAGIAVIHQELSLVGAMSVTDNLCLAGSERLWIDERARRHQATEACRRVGFDLQEGDGFLQRPVEELPLAAMNLLEIAKALSHEARILIMDEPTSALDQPDVERLFSLMARLKAGGCGIIYISHKMEEIYRIADRITVLRDGKLAGTAAAKDFPEPMLIEWMLGRRAESGASSASSGVTDGTLPQRLPALMLSNFHVPGSGPRKPPAVRNLSLTVHPGEILGVAGLQGSGNSELFQGLFGAYGPVCDGTVQVGGAPFRPTSPAHSIRRGVAYLAADRKTTGLVLGLSIEANLNLASMRSVSPGGWIRRSLERSRAARWIDALRVRCASSEQEVGTLSGGNQQKVLLARWLGTEPKVLLLEDPTRGVDIGSKGEIHRILRRWAAEGAAILLISSELPELLALSDRVAVMHRGEMTAEFDRSRATKERVLAAALGAAS